MSFKPRHPDYFLKARIGKDRSGVLGSAWINKSGTISIRLAPGAVLDWHLSTQGTIILAPFEKPDFDTDEEEVVD